MGAKKHMLILTIYYGIFHTRVEYIYNTNMSRGPSVACLCDNTHLGSIEADKGDRMAE